ncbi:MAG: hypothetical protein RIE73_17255 [Coleofasciculus sp. C1-SOL-03]|uniref:hypothetical protein n=1 Tax=Coleofasciculus sp. C1-SOL-03 TaxID=3069522 RepID=UPI0032FFCA76
MRAPFLTGELLPPRWSSCNSTGQQRSRLLNLSISCPDTFSYFVGTMAKLE